MKKNKNIIFEISTFLTDIFQPENNIFKRSGHYPADLLDFIRDTIGHSMDKLKTQIGKYETTEVGKINHISEMYIDLMVEACEVAVKNYADDMNNHLYELSEYKTTVLKDKLTGILVDKFETPILSRMFIEYMTLQYVNPIIIAIKNKP